MGRFSPDESVLGGIMANQPIPPEHLNPLGYGVSSSRVRRKAQAPGQNATVLKMSAMVMQRLSARPSEVAPGAAIDEGAARLAPSTRIPKIAVLIVFRMDISLLS